MLTELAVRQLIRLYKANEFPYGVFLKWDQHQRIRNKRSRIPEPGGDARFIDEPSAPSQPEPIKPSAARTAMFVEFWKLWPEAKRKERADAEAAWAKIKPVDYPGVLKGLKTAQPLTIIGGFRQWQKQGRKVRTGEHAAGYIYVPLIPKGAENGEEPAIGADDVRFRMVPVFDVSQTDGNT